MPVPPKCGIGGHAREAPALPISLPQMHRELVVPVGLLRPPEPSRSRAKRATVCAQCASISSPRPKFMLVENIVSLPLVVQPAAPPGGHRCASISSRDRRPLVTKPGGHAVEHGDDRHGGHLRIDDARRSHLRRRAPGSPCGTRLISGACSRSISLKFAVVQIAQLHIGDEHLSRPVKMITDVKPDESAQALAAVASPGSSAQASQRLRRL
jgi:hypothetical protein